MLCYALCVTGEVKVLAGGNCCFNANGYLEFINDS